MRATLQTTAALLSGTTGFTVAFHPPGVPNASVNFGKRMFLLPLPPQEVLESESFQSKSGQRYLARLHHETAHVIFDAGLGAVAQEYRLTGVLANVDVEARALGVDLVGWERLVSALLDGRTEYKYAEYYIGVRPSFVDSIQAVIDDPTQFVELPDLVQVLSAGGESPEMGMFTALLARAGSMLAHGMAKSALEVLPSEDGDIELPRLNGVLRDGEIPARLVAVLLRMGCDVVTEGLTGPERIFARRVVEYVKKIQLLAQKPDGDSGEGDPRGEQTGGSEGDHGDPKGSGCGNLDVGKLMEELEETSRDEAAGRVQSGSGDEETSGEGTSGGEDQDAAEGSQEAQGGDDAESSETGEGQSDTGQDSEEDGWLSGIDLSDVGEASLEAPDEVTESAKTTAQRLEELINKILETGDSPQGGKAAGFSQKFKLYDKTREVETGGDPLVLQRARYVSSQIRKYLRSVTLTNRVYEQEEGTLDNDALVDIIYHGKRDVFEDEMEQVDVDPNNVAVVTLVDTSGSMHATVGERETQLGALLIGDVLNLIGVPFAYYVFASNLNHIKSFNGRWSARSGAVNTLYIGGNTNIGQSLGIVRAALMRRRERMKVLFLFSDGMAGDPRVAQTEITVLERNGVVVVPMGVCGGLRGLHFDRPIVQVGDLYEMADNIVEFFQRLWLPRTGGRL